MTMLSATFLLLQTISPGDAKGWSDAVEKGGVIGVLVLVIVLACIALQRRWLIPGYVVADKDAQIAELKAERRQFLELLLRASNVAEGAVGAIQQQRG